MCDSQTEYVLNVYVYTGEYNDTSAFTLGKKVGLQLIKCVKNSSILVAFNDIFVQNGIYSCGS